MQPTSKSSPRGEQLGETYDQVIRELYKGDLLEKNLFIRPRNKCSGEVQILLSKGFQCQAGVEAGTETMRKIIHSFMVANKYVGAGKNLHDRKALQYSLMVRLDLHNPSNEAERRKYNDCKGNVFGYIWAQTIIWKEGGIITRWSVGNFPIFHPCVEEWTYRYWNGEMSENVTNPIQISHVTGDALAAPAEIARLILEETSGAKQAIVSHRKLSPTRVFALNMRSNPKQASTASLKPSSDVVSAFPKSKYVSPPYSPHASGNSDALQELWSRKAHYTIHGEWTEERDASGPVPGYADSYLSDSYEVNDDFRKEKPGFTRGYHDEPDNEILNGDQRRYESIPIITTTHATQDQYIGSQTTEPSYTQPVQHASRRDSTQRLFQGIFRHLPGAQPVAPSYVSRARLLEPPRITLQSHKRPNELCYERPEAKRRCSTRVLPATKPSTPIDTTQGKVDFDELHDLQNTEDTGNSNAVERLESTQMDHIPRTFDFTSRSHLLQSPADTSSNQLPTSTLETQLCFLKLLSTLSLAHSILSGFIPTSLSEFTTLSRDWDPSRGKASCLIEALSKCKDHISAMGKYFEIAVELVEILLEQREKSEVAAGEIHGREAAIDTKESTSPRER